MLSKFLQKLGLFLTFTTLCFGMEDEKFELHNIINQNINKYASHETTSFLEINLKYIEHVVGFKGIPFYHGGMDTLQACEINSNITATILKKENFTLEDKQFLTIAYLLTQNHRNNKYQKKGPLDAYARNPLLVDKKIESDLKKISGEITLCFEKFLNPNKNSKYPKQRILNERTGETLVEFDHFLEIGSSVELSLNNYIGPLLLGVFEVDENNNYTKNINLKYFQINNGKAIVIEKQENHCFYIQVILRKAPFVIIGDKKVKLLPFDELSHKSVIDIIVSTAYRYGVAFDQSYPPKEFEERGSKYFDVRSTGVIHPRYLEDLVKTLKEKGAAPNYYPAEFLTGKKHKEEQKKPFKDRTAEEQKEYLENKVDLKKILDLYDKTNKNNHSEKIKSINNQLKHITDPKNIQISPKKKHRTYLYLDSLYGETNVH